MGDNEIFMSTAHLALSIMSRLQLVPCRKTRD